MTNDFDMNDSTQQACVIIAADRASPAAPMVLRRFRQLAQISPKGRQVRVAPYPTSTATRECRCNRSPAPLAGYVLTQFRERDVTQTCGSLKDIDFPAMTADRCPDTVC
jgi:hypothetical protein